jgi:CheY-like chemotaxis protein
METWEGGDMNVAVQARAGEAGRGRHRKVLLVDDNVDVRESLRDLLEAAGFEVAVVDGGASALDYLQQRGGAGAPDVILLDFAMPGMTGAELQATLARRPALARIPVVFVTADTHAPATAAASDCVCLGKPLDLDDLLAALDRQMRAPG